MRPYALYVGFEVIQGASTGGVYIYTRAGGCGQFGAIKKILTRELESD